MKLKLIFNIILLASVGHLAATEKLIPPDPRAEPAALVLAGQARFTVLTPRLIRLEWSADGRFEDRASLVFINRRLPAPHFHVSDSGGVLVIDTGALALSYQKAEGKFSPSNLSIKLKYNDITAAWRPGQSDAQNLKGTTRTLDGTNGEKDVNLEEGLISRAGWALVDDSARPLFDGSELNWVGPRPAGDRQDWYFFGYGHDYKAALGDFTRVAGRIPIPPRFAFGYWWSRYWTYSDEELRGLIADMHHYDVPIDVLIIDMDWHETWGLSSRNTRRDPFGQSVGWTGYTWNRSLFPDPPRFLAWAHEQGLKTALNLHPASGIAPMEEKYAAFAKAYGFAGKSKEYIPFRIEEKKWTQTWFDVILHPLEKQGVDFWWLDWQAWQDNKKVKNLGNTWWLNYVFFSDMERGGQKRPLLFHRWGGLGNHRYQIGFSGDTVITWDSLAFQPYFTATAANVGYGYWSHDIGGHMGSEDLDPELYLRWLQWGALSPILRTHSTKNAVIERRIWKYPRHVDMMRDALHLRYALFPYLYAAARRAYDEGLAICRPMYYDYPEAPEAYEFKGQYLFGADMIVAPVTKKADPQSELAAQKIWLPQGSWYEWSSGTLIAGGKALERSFCLNEIPLYIRAGTVLPMRPEGGNLQQDSDRLVLTIIPGPGDLSRGQASIYEDDGATVAYQTGSYAATLVRQETLTLPAPVRMAGGSVEKSGEAGRSRTTVDIAARQGSYAGMPANRAYEIRMPGTEKPLAIALDGRSLPAFAAPGSAGWLYDATRLTTHVFTPAIDCGRPARITIAWRQGRDDARLDGKIGLLNRLPRIVQLMKDEVNRHDNIANAPPLVLKADGLPARLRYHPEKVAALLAEFDADLPQLVQQVMDFPRADPAILAAVIHLLPLDKPIAPMPKIKLDHAISGEPTTVAISHDDRLALVTYTLDGSLPGEKSLPYRGPFRIDKSLTVRARCFWPGFIPSLPAAATFQRTYAKSVALASPCSPRYDGGGEFALTNGLLGNAGDYRSDWVGFQATDMAATIELFGRRDIKRIAVRFLQSQEEWIFLPSAVEIEVSSDGVRFHKVFGREMKAEAEARDDRDAAQVREIGAAISAHDVSHIRVSAKNIGVCPAWHNGAGGRAWLFCDEIIVE